MEGIWGVADVDADEEEDADEGADEDEDMSSSSQSSHASKFGVERGVPRRASREVNMPDGRRGVNVLDGRRFRAGARSPGARAASSHCRSSVTSKSAGSRPRKAARLSMQPAI